MRQIIVTWWNMIGLWFYDMVYVAAMDIVSMGQNHWTSSVNKQQFGRKTNKG